MSGTPTTVEGALIQQLLADAGVSALIGTRIHPFLTPTDLPLPNLTWQRPLTDRRAEIGAWTNQGPTGYGVASVQFDAWAATALTARQVCTAVRQCLNGWSNPTVNILSVRVDDERDLPAVLYDGQAVPQQRSMIAVKVQFRDPS